MGCSVMVISRASCEEFIDLIVQVGERAKQAVKNAIADMDALDRWEDDGGPCND